MSRFRSGDVRLSIAVGASALALALAGCGDSSDADDGTATDRVETGSSDAPEASPSSGGAAPTSSSPSPGEGSADPNESTGPGGTNDSAPNPTGDSTPGSTGPPETVVFTTEPAFAPNSDVTTVGIDRVQFGMTRTQAENALAVRLIGDGPRACFTVKPSNGPEGIEFMVTDGTIERVDITTDLITTRSGAGVGMTKQDVLDLFDGNIEERDHPSDPSKEWLVFVPSDEADGQFRVIFELSAGVVESYRSGRLPQVEYADGCP